MSSVAMSLYGIVVLMALQAALGLLFSERYRDAEWIRATWFGNDWITLVIGAPALALAARARQRGSLRAELSTLGILGYAIYNYAFYALGAALNVFFALYIATLVSSIIAIVSGLFRIDAQAVALHFSAKTRARLIGGYFVFVAGSLTLVWLGLWAAHVFAGRPTPVEPEAFRLVAVLDLTLMVPSLTTGGLLLWQRRPWGFIIAAIAGVQASLYLLVLTVNSLVAIHRGLAEAPGELPIWATLAVLTTVATALLLGSVRSDSLPAQTSGS